MNEIDYIDHLRNHKNDEFWRNILNTQYNYLPHKLELLNSDQQRNQLAIQKDVKDNIQEYLSSQNSVLKCFNEIKWMRSITRSSTKRESIRKNFDNLQNCEEFENHSSDYSEIFDLENQYKQVFRSQNLEHLRQLLEWTHNFILKQKNQNNQNIGVFLEGILTKILKQYLPYFLSIFKVQKKTDTTSMIKQQVDQITQIGQHLDTFQDNFFMQFFMSILRHKMEKQRPFAQSKEFLLQVLTIYESCLQESLFFVNQIQNEQLKFKLQLNYILSKIEIFLQKHLYDDNQFEQTLQIIEYYNGNTGQQISFSSQFHYLISRRVKQLQKQYVKLQKQFLLYGIVQDIIPKIEIEQITSYIQEKNIQNLSISLRQQNQFMCLTLLNNLVIFVSILNTYQQQDHCINSLIDEIINEAQQISKIYNKDFTVIISFLQKIVHLFR